MNEPQRITLEKNDIFSADVEPGKIQVIVLDGINNAAHITEAPEHGHTIIETIKGKLDRIRFDYGFKFNK
ncbi:XtrA/YqaO family protein [Bacillus sp. FSL P4-0248]|uniref:XtrA/YqaO family protein n=1 Tax=Bacillus sp. FSL P4-0248 TaxID=2954582 RepID=UPI003158F02D